MVFTTARRDGGMGFAIADKPVLSFDSDEHGGAIGGVDAAVAVVDAGDGAGSVADEALGHDEAGFFFVGGLLGVCGGGEHAIVERASRAIFYDEVLHLCSGFVGGVFAVGG